jgi:cytoskeleton protein RodZ
MSEVAGAAAGPVAAPTAGRLLREARERQGLHIAALAASIKVTQKKLELLEADRFDALPDATFTRALAQTVCRALKIDSAAVLRLLPPPAGHRLEQVGEGLNAPFRERPGAFVQREGASFAFGPVFWVTTLILIASAVVYFLPSGWLGRFGIGVPVPAPTAASMPAGAQGAASAPMAMLPSEAPIDAPAPPSPDTRSGPDAAPATDAAPVPALPASAVSSGASAAGPT